MSGIVHSLVPGLKNLEILPGKGKQTRENGFAVLHALCIGYLAKLAMLNFDSTLPVDDTVDENVMIQANCRLPPIIEDDDEEEYLNDFESEGSEESEIPEEIFVEVSDEHINWDLFPSQVGDVPIDDEIQAWVPCQFSFDINFLIPEGIEDSKCNHLVSCLETKMAELSTLAESMMAMTISLTKMLEAVAKSGIFDLVVVKTFLEEIVILLETLFKIDVANELPESWNFFKELAILQVKVFDMYMNEENYHHAHDLIWILSKNTEFQKKFLQRCIRESAKFEDVMTEVGVAIESMFSLQDIFIVKLIARLQESKNQNDNFPLVIEC